MTTSPPFTVIDNSGFTNWLASQKASLAVTTYQAGKLFLIGVKKDGRLSVFERTFDHCMGMYASGDGQSIHFSDRYQVWRLEKIQNNFQAYEEYDALYIPQSSSVTGNLDIHDIVVDKSDDVIFVNTLFNCLAKTSIKSSFLPYWRPPFIDQLVAEDRCHLNGLAMRDGAPRYVSAVSQTNIRDSWRDHRENGGVIIDITDDQIVGEELSMPHSPRWYDNKLWVLNSGTGHFGYMDANTGKFQEVTFCPGYMRGLSFIGDYALVGLSKPRKNKAFADLPLQENLSSRKVDAVCGIQIIDTNSGEIKGALYFEGVVNELYDIAILPNVQCPMAIGLRSDEIQHVLKVDE